jgi:thymidine kinase
MNCGKSTALIQVDYNYRERNMNTVIIKPEADTKGSDRVISRLNVERTADILATNKDNLYMMIENWLKEKAPVHCVLVDEAQFLTHSQVDQLFQVAVIQDISVICYGLRTDFQLNGFEGSARLLLLAHSIEELKTICKCGQKAVANGRKIGGRFVFEGAQVAIEGEGSVDYESLCARCYFKYKKQHEDRKRS